MFKFLKIFFQMIPDTIDEGFYRLLIISTVMILFYGIIYKNLFWAFGLTFGQIIMIWFINILINEV